MHGTFATRKQSKQVFLEQLSPSDFSLSGFPTSKPAPTPFLLYSAISSRPVQAQLKWVRLLASTGPASPVFKTSLFFHSLVFFIHLSHTTLESFKLSNFVTTTLLTVPETELSAFNHWCRLHFSPCSSYTCSRQTSWMTKKKYFQFPFGITHCWGLVALRFPPTCPLLVWGLLRSRC